MRRSKQDVKGTKKRVKRVKEGPKKEEMKQDVKGTKKRVKRVKERPKKEVEITKEEKWHLYCLYWRPDANKGDAYVLKRNGEMAKRTPKLCTYVGVTTDPKRRLRQHNGEIVGGAKYTTRTKGGTWKFLYRISGFPNRSVVQQWEYNLHRRGKRLNTICVVCNRIATLRAASNMERVTKKAMKSSKLTLTHEYPEGPLPTHIPRTKCVCFLSKKGE